MSNEIIVDEFGNCEWQHPFLDNVGLASHELYQAKFRICFVAGKEFLVPISDSLMLNPYAARSHIRQIIERYTNKSDVRYIACVIATFNDNRPDLIIYYSTRGIKSP